MNCIKFNKEKNKFNKAKGILCLYSGIFDKGGIARYGRYQINALRERFGFKSVYVLSLMSWQSGDIEEPFEVNWSGRMPLSKFSRICFSIVATKFAILHKPSIVLTGHINLGPLGWFLARINNAHLVQNIYGWELWSDISEIRKQALARSDLVISDCQNSADVAIKTSLVKNQPTVIWDCVDIIQYTPSPPDYRVLKKYGVNISERFRVLFLARLNYDTRYKGIERLLKIAKQLPEDQFEFIIAGKGDYLEILKIMARDLSIEKQVTFTGAIHEEDMPNIYRCADAFYLVSEVGPSKGEGLPLTPLEAMACGVPVVVGNQDGSKEILKDGGGLCCDPYNLDGQARYLRMLKENRSFHEKEKVAARSRAEKSFSYFDFAEKTTSALLPLMKQ